LYNFKRFAFNETHKLGCGMNVTPFMNIRKVTTVLLRQEKIVSGFTNGITYARVPEVTSLIRHSLL
jgi:hypothetical protein